MSCSQHSTKVTVCKAWFRATPNLIAAPSCPPHAPACIGPATRTSQPASPTSLSVTKLPLLPSSGGAKHSHQAEVGKCRAKKAPLKMHHYGRKHKERQDINMNETLSSNTRREWGENAERKYKKCLDINVKKQTGLTLPFIHVRTNRRP